jgi:5-methyltetrahydrofolate--homocysteine methyltransferase
MDHVAGKKIDVIVTEQKDRSARRKQQRANAVKPLSVVAANAPKVEKSNPVPVPPFWGRRLISGIKPQNVFPYINEIALFTGQWGFKRKGLSEADYEKLLDDSARPVFDALQKRAVAEGFIEPRVVYGYFPVQAQGDELIVYRAEDFAHDVACGCTSCKSHGNAVGIVNGKLAPRVEKPREHLRFQFPRQNGRRLLCISDFYRTVESGEYDVLALQLVTVGDKSTALAEELRKENRYQDYLYLHGFGVECAEALAEFWHKRVRQELGFGSEDDSDVRKIFQQQYRGSRYSFGYPACPNLEDRAKIVELLNPSEIGVELSENYMLVPEQSTDAIVAHHPQAKYFDVD